MDQDFVIADQFTFSRRNVSSRAQSEKVFSPLSRVGNNQKKTWPKEGKARRDTLLGKPCDLENEGHCIRLPVRGASWRGAMGREGREGQTVAAEV